MELNLKGKVVLLSGGAGERGSIGQEIFFALAKEGAIPVVLDRNGRGFGYVEELQSQELRADFIKTDMVDPDQIKKAVDEVVEKYGKIDVVINNVGKNDGVGLDGSVEDFVDSLKLNMVSFYALVNYALPKLKESKGNIINIGSKVALTGQGGTSGYAASKGGVLALTREWAVDLIDFGIRVNAIIIAECWTPAYNAWIRSIEDGEEKLDRIRSKIPLGNRMTTTEEISNTVLFLISDKASHTTGQFVHIDGGYVHLDRAMLGNENHDKPYGTHKGVGAAVHIK